MGRVLRAGMFFLLVLVAGRASAHDFWLEPSNYMPALGPVGVGLRVGTAFQGDALPRDPRLLLRFVALAGGEERTVTGAFGSEPAGSFALGDSDGLIVIAYESRPTTAELTRAEFDRYLVEEGVESLRTGRVVDAHDGHARDAFSRHAKAIVQSVAGPRKGFDHRVGLTLELVPERNPYDMPGGGKLPIRLFYRGHPSAEARVSAISRTWPDRIEEGITDVEGRVVLRLGPGEWLVKSVHVESVLDFTSNYRSYWSSLVFFIPATLASRE